MSEEHKAAREMVAKQTRIWMHWREDGEIGLILNLVTPDGKPSSTVGSCKLVHAHEYIGMMMRGLECGAIIAMRDAKEAEKAGY